MEALDTLNTKLDKLLKKHLAAEAENSRLKDTIAKHDKAMEALHKKIASLEHGMVSVHLGSTVSGEDEKVNMRRQLDNVIAEIDKILNTLND